MLPCQHTFCLKCLTTYCSVDINIISCPTCRAKSQLPEEGFAKLPNNFAVQNILELLVGKEETSGESQQKAEKTVTFPEKCGRCKRQRKVSTNLHGEQPLCHECEILQSVEVRSVAADLLASLKAGKESVSSIYDITKNRMEKLEGNINVAFETIVAALTIDRDSMLSQLLQVLEQQNSRMTVLLSGIDEAIAFLELGQGEHFKTTDLVSIKEKSQSLLNDVKAFNNIRMSFDETQFKLSIDELPTRKVTTTNLEEESSKKVAPATADEQSLFYRKKSQSPKLRFTHQLLHRPAGVAVSPWTGEIYVAGTDSHRVLVFDRQGNYQRCLGDPADPEAKFLCPFGIAFSLENEEIYVTDKWRNCIQVFDKNDKYRRQLGGKNGQGNASFKSPVGLAVNRNGLIYVCDTCNDRILVLDKHGVQIREIGEPIREVLSDGKKVTKCEFNEPTSVCVSADGSKIFVCDHGNHRIKIFNEDGVRLDSLGFRGMARGQLEGPECLVVDANGLIIVGDNGNMRVQIFRPNGDFVFAFGSKKSEDFSEISGLALTPDSEIIVSDFKTHTISIY